MNSAPAVPRNPGPSWGYGFMLWLERCTPRWIFRPLLWAGTWVGVATMPAQRTHSRAYLSVVLGRPPTLGEIGRHFFAFAEFLVLKLRASRGAPVRCLLEPEHGAAFTALARSGRPALFGTFHFGGSDLLGYLLSEHGRHVTVIRLRVGNSTDTRRLERQFAGKTSFLWVNDPQRLIFDLKAALEAGESLALQCDRLEFTARAEGFDFLGARRLFPFAIYHLAVLFDRPVGFCLAVPGAEADTLRIFAAPLFTPVAALGRDGNLRAARGHFQQVLAQLEALVRQHPFLWFNFLPLNPELPASSPAAS